MREFVLASMGAAILTTCALVAIPTESVQRRWVEYTALPAPPAPPPASAWAFEDAGIRLDRALPPSLERFYKTRNGGQLHPAWVGEVVPLEELQPLRFTDLPRARRAEQAGQARLARALQLTRDVGFGVLVLDPETRVDGEWSWGWAHPDSGVQRWQDGGFEALARWGR